MKIALAYDRVNKIGGAERILTTLHEIWPDAPLFTSVYSKNKALWADGLNIKTSFIQKIPFAKDNHELFPYLMPYAFESFNLDEFDIVISITSAEAKGIITKPKTLHVCYCLTPSRYLWNDSFTYLNGIHCGIFTGVVKSLISSFCVKLRLWDKIASERPDCYLAISCNVAKRIKKFYRKNSDVIYPPVDTKKFIPGFAEKNIKDNYYLIVSRLVVYKSIDIAINAFNKIGKKLIIIGIGKEEKYLKKIAGKNIEFITKNLTDEEVIRYYQNCQALIFPGEEDFGLTPIEAQSCGKPVIAYGSGGALESVKEGVTGEFFYPKTEKALIGKVNLFNPEKYKKEDCIKQAEKFSTDRFKKFFKQNIELLYKKYLSELDRNKMDLKGEK